MAVYVAVCLILNELGECCFTKSLDSQSLKVDDRSLVGEVMEDNERPARLKSCHKLGRIKFIALWPVNILRDGNSSLNS